MKRNIHKYFCGLSLLLLSYTSIYSQVSDQTLSIEQAVNLAMQNHQQLKVTALNKNISEQQTQLIKQQRLPNLAFTANASYIGDALILDRDFSKVMTKDMPHFGNSYAIQASELLFKGGAINKNIELAEIGEQLASLDLVQDQQAIKFLVISNYLDVYKLIHQEQVYQNNKKLAQIRLENVNRYYKEGMMTRNEVIRGELVLQNMDQALLSVDNNLSILNYNLAIALGLPTSTKITPNEALVHRPLEGDYNYYLDLAYAQHPMIQRVEKGVEAAQKKIEIANTDKYPALAAVGGYNMSRPITTSNPVMDMYSNAWQVGVSLTYNIDNLYKTPKKVKLEKLQKNKAEESLTLVQQQLEMGVNAAYTKYDEAIQNANLLKKSQQLAQENYKIIEAKYLNQLAIQAEMTDATNAKLEAELQYANAEINVLYQYYNLLKSTGTL
ncbi:TolC family protein [Myroides odoratimimus]|uniref:TolC family protein n=1 Tax=Myroides odoratimimus TaxID=76832 RepID=UPI002576C2E5|nr:TolC family protein [Myroides odoratimimus]MDM1447451.1 TolC family protein [Myroides odoratimimus]